MRGFILRLLVIVICFGIVIWDPLECHIPAQKAYDNVLNSPRHAYGAEKHIAVLVSATAAFECSWKVYPPLMIVAFIMVTITFLIDFLDIWGTSPLYRRTHSWAESQNTKKLS